MEEELIQTVQTNIFQSNTYKIDFDETHLNNEREIQER